MSAATEIPPVVYIPERARTAVTRSGSRPRLVPGQPPALVDPAVVRRPAARVGQVGWADPEAEALTVPLPRGLLSPTRPVRSPERPAVQPVRSPERPAVQPVRSPERPGVRPVRSRPAQGRPVGCTHLAGPVRAGVLATGAQRRALVGTPLRLTRRGIAAIAVLVGLVCAALLLSAWASAPAAPARVVVPATVTVGQGDTLWSIASRIEPNADPRGVVDSLMSVNHLGTVALVPGQVLRTH